MRHLAVIGIFLLSLATSAWSSAVNWKVGDVFTAVGQNYQVYRFDAATKGYVLVETFAAGSSAGYAGGCAFDGQLNLYGTNSAGQVLEFSSVPHDAGSPQLVGGAPIVSPAVDARSIVFDSSGNFYVGSSNAFVLRYVANSAPAPDGSAAPFPPASMTYSAAVPAQLSTSLNADQVDLASDQTNLFFASSNPDSRTNPDTIGRIDLTNASSGSSFVLPNDAWAVRLLTPANIKPGNPPSAINGMLVADDDAVLRLNSTGATVDTFTVGKGMHSFRFLALDPDGLSFWAGDATSGNVYRFSLSNASLLTGSTIATGSTHNRPLGGVCVYGQPQLNVAALHYQAGSAVLQSAAFGDPHIDASTLQPTIDSSNPPEPLSADYHTWTAMVDQVLAPFTMVITSTPQGPQPSSTQIQNATQPLPLLGRFDEYFCNQAQPFPGDFANGCTPMLLPQTGANLVPIPYTDQVTGLNGIPTASGTGIISGSSTTQRQAGNRAVYRIANPPVPCTGTTPLTPAGCVFSGNVNIAIRFKQPPVCQSALAAVPNATLISPACNGTCPAHTSSVSTAANCYVPPRCSATTFINNPRFMRDPSEAPPTDAPSYHQFAFDSTDGFLLDIGVVSGSGRTNDHAVVDRCPGVSNTAGNTCFASASINNPLPKSTVNSGSNVPVKVTVTDCNGRAVTNAVAPTAAPFTNITIVVTDSTGSLERATAQSFPVFTQNGGAGGTYSAVLQTNNLKRGPTTFCITSVSTNNQFDAGTAVGTGQFTPVCTQFTIK